MTELLCIRDSALNRKEKAKRALRVTVRSDVAKHLAMLIGTELKRVGWDDRSWPSRLALAGVLLALGPFWGEGAGIVAMGGAIGVPLWVVFGAGGAFAGVVLQELGVMPRK